MHITFVDRPTLNLTTNKRRIISECFKDSAMHSVQGLLIYYHAFVRTFDRSNG